jgi:hypothetical protein
VVATDPSPAKPSGACSPAGDKVPVESLILEGQPVPFTRCPKCAARFRPFMRGQVQRRPWRIVLAWWPPIRIVERPYCALICAVCKRIVGYEAPL